jgi:hypothetical protein
MSTDAAKTAAQKVKTIIEVITRDKTDTAQKEPKPAPDAAEEIDPVDQDSNIEVEADEWVCCGLLPFKRF